MLSKVVNFGVYAICDKDLEGFGLPFVAENDTIAIRNVVGDFIKIADVSISSLSIVEIGQYDCSNGHIEGYEQGCYRLVISGDELLVRVKLIRRDLEKIKESVDKEYKELVKIKEDLNKEDK